MINMSCNADLRTTEIEHPSGSNEKFLILVKLYVGEGGGRE